MIAARDLLKRLGRPRAVGGGVVVAALGLLGFERLFAGPGYEMALAAGLLCPATAAVVVAIELREGGRSGVASLGRAVETSGALVLLAYLVAFLHGLRAGLCDLSGGTVLFALGPGVGTVVAGVWGLVASEIGRRARKRPVAATVALAIAGPLGSALFNLGLFYATPTVFAFDPFVGVFHGAIYDTVLSGSGLLSYRAATACTLFACYVVSLRLRRPAAGEPLRWSWPRRPGLLLVAGAAAAASLLSVVLGHHLGHWQTASTIAEGLGGELSVGSCRVVYDVRLEPRRVRLFARDCDAHVRHVSRWLEAPAPAEPVTAYLFLDPGQKRFYMGAANTSIAKPWRAEIYVHDKPYPHDVVGHELVHVLAGAFGRGPFHIAGALGGLLPNPGLIEGIAEAAAPDADNLSGDEWAAAMRRIEVLPPLRQLFSLSFFAGHSATSYTAAGSFVEHVHRTQGVAVVKRWYGGEDLTSLSGQSWDVLERAWWAHLDALPLDDAALKTARARFDRPGIFARRCPHEVDERLGWANGRAGTGDLAGARDAYGDVLALDPGNVHAHLGLARCQDRGGDMGAAEQSYRALAGDDALGAGAQLRALESLGDLRLRTGDVEGARERYDELSRLLVDEDRLRTIDVKTYYADLPEARAALVALLVGTTADGPGHDEALDRIGLWRAAQPRDGTPDYLFGRQHFSAANYELAANRLDAALARALPVGRVQSEALRLRLIVACALDDAAMARAMLGRYQNHPLVPPAAAAAAERLLERCAPAAASSAL